MTSDLDPKDIIDSAEDLLSSIEKANDEFVKKTNKTVKKINHGLKDMKKTEIKIEEEYAKAAKKINKQVLDYLSDKDK